MSTMPRFKIAVSKKVTKCDTIWYAEKEGIYVVTDGTNPAHVDEGWECYQIDIDRALKEGIGHEMDAYEYPIIFPRPLDCGGNRDTRMTMREMLHILFHCWKSGRVPRGTYFRMRVGDYVFEPHLVPQLPTLDKLAPIG